MTEVSAATSMQTFARLLGYVKQNRMMLAVAILGNILYSAMDAWFITLIQPLMDEGLVGGDISYIKKAPLFIIGVLAVRGVASVLSTYCMAWVGQSIVQKMREQLMEQYIALPNKIFDSIPSGQLVSKITFNTQQIASASSDALTKFVREGALLVFSVGTLFYVNWRLASIYFVSAPIIAVLASLTSKRFRIVSKRIQSAMGGVTQAAHEVVNGTKVVKTYGGQQYETERFRKVANLNRRQNLKLILTKAISVPLIQLIAAMSMAIVVFYSAFEIENGTLSAGQFVEMFLFMIAIFRPLKALSDLNSVMQQGIAAAHDIFETIDLPKEKDTGTLLLESNPKIITLNHVSFYYDAVEKKVLDDISMEIRQGQTVALVGHSGSGKSTITNLLLRFYDAQQGEIKFDEHPIEDYTLESLRKHIAFVSQHVTLFNDTIRANIAYAESEVDEERLLQAAEQAHALEFINQLSEGFDSQIGENGAKLSGGQRQRLAIARAIYKDTPLIILDEATSALDTESERYIQAALDALTKNRTTLVIAHRLSTIENADTIIVMESGRIVERGKHAELLQLNGSYARLHSMQFSDVK